MGFSERTGALRRARRPGRRPRRLTAALGLAGPVVTVGHDWGGVISPRLGARPPRRSPASCSPTPPSTTRPARPSRRRCGSPCTRPCTAGARRRRRRLPARRRSRWRRPPLDAGGPRRLPGPVPDRRPPRRRSADFVADIPADAPPPSYPALERDRRGRARARRSGAAAVGPARPGLLRPLPATTSSTGCRTPTCTASRAPATWSPRTGDIAAPVLRWLGDNADRLDRSAAGHPAGEPDAGRRRRPRTPAPGPDPGRRSTELPAATARGHRRRRNGSRTAASRRSLSWRRARMTASHASRRACRHRRPHGRPRSACWSPRARPDAVALRVPAARRRGRRGRRGPRHRGLTRAVAGAGPDFLIGIDRALAAAACSAGRACASVVAGPAGRPRAALSASHTSPRRPRRPRSRRRPDPAAGSGPGRRRRRPLHLRLHRSRQGRASTRTGSCPRCGNRGRARCGIQPGRTPGGGLRAVRPAGPGAGQPSR